MNIHTIKAQTERMEKTVLTLFDSNIDREDFLPQILDEDEVIMNTLQEQCHLDHRYISASLHRQIDPSYQ